MTPAAEAFGLTEGEVLVLELFARGWNVSGVAEATNVTVQTVHHTASRINNKLGATNRVHAMYVAVKKGIIR